jgi:hypothetical protein
VPGSTALEKTKKKMAQPGGEAAAAAKKALKKHHSYCLIYWYVRGKSVLPDVPIDGAFKHQ